MSKRSKTTEIDVEPGYGTFGWKEFSEVRTDLLESFYSARRRTISRPVRTSHGKFAEAKIREWLKNSLPTRFGVTSGYIIPNYVTSEYVVEHFDVIIYDQLNAPVLWADSDADDSEQGKSRAIPCAYVKAVYEVKSTLSPKNAKDAKEKLSSLNSMFEYLPKNFFCGAVFFELPNTTVRKNTILKHVTPELPVLGYYGGIVLSSAAVEGVSGLFGFCQSPTDDAHKKQINASHPIVEDISRVEVCIDEDGNMRIGGGSGKTMAAVQFHAFGGRWRPSIGYPASYAGDRVQVNLNWSKNSFSRFFLELLEKLTGEQTDSSKFVFGQIFDPVKKCEE